MKKLILLFLLFTIHCSLFTAKAQCTAVSIVTQPTNQNDSIPGNAHFTVDVAGTAPYNYYWFVNGTVADSTINSPSTTNTYNTPPLTMADSNNTYYCVITNCSGANTVTTTTVHLICMPVVITIQPLSQTFTAGTITTISFSVTVTGTPPFNYYWYKGTTLVKTTIDTAGHTSIYSFAANPVVFGMNGSTYHVVIKGCQHGIYFGPCTVVSNNAVLTVNCPPMSAPYASNSGTPFMCTPGTITVSTPTVAGATYNWTGYGTSTQQSPTFSVSTMCDWVVGFSVTYTLNGCTSPSGSTACQVSTNNASFLNPPPNLTICSGGVVSYIPIGGGSCYGGAGHSHTTTSCVTGFSTSTLGPIYDILTNTTSTPCVVNYNINALSAGYYSCGLNTYYFTVTVLPSQTPISVSSATICEGQTATLTASGAATYTWSAGATSTGASTASASPMATSTYTVTGANTYGCTSIATSTVTVNPTPNIIVNSPAICIGDTAVLIASGGNTYVWSAGAMPVGIDSAIVSPSITTSYTVSSTNSFGCSDTETAVVTINSASFSQSLSVCAGDSVTVGTNVYSSEGTFIDSLTTIAGCDSIVTTNLAVDNLDISTTQSGASITANQSGASYQWLWCNGGNTPIAGATNQSYPITINGDFAVVITNGACSDTSACVPFYSVGLNETTIDNNQLIITPNPVINELGIRNYELGIQSVKIYNVLGTCVMHHQLGQKPSGLLSQHTGSNNQQLTLDVSTLEKGLYFIQINNTINKKFVKE